MRQIDELIIHCSATPPDWRAEQSPARQVAEIRRWHVEGNGWSDIGYHWLIARDGTIVPGRPVERTGAHVRGHNARTIGICLLGGHRAAATDRFEDHFTPAQDRALRDLIRSLRTEYPSIETISGHNQYSAKGCPGFSVPEWYAGAVQNKPRRGPLTGLFAALRRAAR